MVHTFTSRLCGLHATAYIFVLIGAINWGLVAVGGYMGANLNVVNRLLGAWPMVEQLIYLIVGLSAIAMLFQKSCDYCTEEIV